MSKTDGIWGNLRYFLQCDVKGCGYDVQDLPNIGKDCMIGIKLRRAEYEQKIIDRYWLFSSLCFLLSNFVEFSKY